MALALLFFGVAFAAFCVWLTVRIVNRRERWAKWTLAVVLGLPVVCVLSFGPACWWLSEPLDEGPAYLHPADGLPHAPVLYWPIGEVIVDGPEWLSRAFSWYAMLGTECVMVPIEGGGRFILVSRD